VNFDGQSAVRQLEAGSFYECRLREITIPTSIEVTAEDSFRKCVFFETVVLQPGSRLQVIEKHAFAETGLARMVIPASVEALSDECFTSCAKVQSVSFEERPQLRTLESNPFPEPSPAFSHHCFPGRFPDLRPPVVKSAT
jgi:hypothetical protein